MYQPGFSSSWEGTKIYEAHENFIFISPWSTVEERLEKGLSSEILYLKYVFTPKTLLICTHSKNWNSEANFHSHISILSIPFSYCYRPGILSIRQLERLFLATLSKHHRHHLPPLPLASIPANLNRLKITFLIQLIPPSVHFFILARALCSLSLYSPVLARQ